MKQVEEMYREYYKKKNVKFFYANKRRSLYARLIDIVNTVPVKNVIDIGTGMGDLVELLNANNIKAIGVDFPIVDIIEYHKKLKNNKLFVYGSISDEDIVYRIRKLQNNEMNTMALIIDTLRYIEDQAITSFVESYKPTYLLIKEVSNTSYMRTRRRNEKDLRLLSPQGIVSLFNKYEAKTIYISKYILSFKDPQKWLLMLINLVSPTYTIILQRKK